MLNFNTMAIDFMRRQCLLAYKSGVFAAIVIVHGFYFFRFVLFFFFRLCYVCLNNNDTSPRKTKRMWHNVLLLPRETIGYCHVSDHSRRIIAPQSPVAFFWMIGNFPNRYAPQSPKSPEIFYPIYINKSSNWRPGRREHLGLLLCNDRTRIVPVVAWNFNVLHFSERNAGENLRFVIRRAHALEHDIYKRPSIRRCSKLTYRRGQCRIEIRCLYFYNEETNRCGCTRIWKKKKLWKFITRSLRNIRSVERQLPRYCVADDSARESWGNRSQPFRI